MKIVPRNDAAAGSQKEIAALKSLHPSKFDRIVEDTQMLSSDDCAIKQRDRKYWEWIRERKREGDWCKEVEVRSKMIKVGTLR